MITFQERDFGSSKMAKHTKPPKTVFIIAWTIILKQHKPDACTFQHDLFKGRVQDWEGRGRCIGCMNISALTTKFGVKTISYYKRRLGRRQVGKGLVRKPISSFLSFRSLPEDLLR